MIFTVSCCLNTPLSLILRIIWRNTAIPEKKKLTDNNVSLLTIFYLINALFVIESSVVRKHGYICTTEEFKKDLITARTRYSRPIVDTLFDNIRLYIANNPKLIVPRVSINGAIRFGKNNRYPESAALIYLLNFETELKRFIESADIELSSSKAERSLKLGICARKSFMFLSSENGGSFLPTTRL